MYAIYLTLLIYKLAALGAGLVLCVLGYRLFVKGIWGAAGDIDVRFKDRAIVVRSAAPGSFFAVLGAAVIVATIWQGLSLDSGGLGGDALVLPAEQHSGTDVLR